MSDTVFPVLQIVGPDGVIADIKPPFERCGRPAGFTSNRSPEREHKFGVFSFDLDESVEIDEIFPRPGNTTFRIDRVERIERIEPAEAVAPVPKKPNKTAPTEPGTERPPEPHSNSAAPAPANVYGDLIRSGMADLENAFKTGDHGAARDAARQVGTFAEMAADRHLLLEMGNELEGLADYAWAGELLAKGGLIGSSSPLREWRGERMADKRLLVVRRIRDNDAVIRLAHLAQRAADSVSGVTVVVDAVLSPLLSRSFPLVEFLTESPPDLSGFGAVASYETLMQHLGLIDEFSAAAVVPLVADPARASELRRRYQDDRRPLVGISWYDVDGRKDLPDAAAWAGALRQLDARYVLLQCGAGEATLSSLAAHGAPPIFVDDEIGVPSDIDGLAAQIAATDAVLTVGNQAAHLAGAKGHRTAVILGANRQNEWPTVAATLPWYSNLLIVRDQPNAAALDQAVATFGNLRASN